MANYSDAMVGRVDWNSIGRSFTWVFAASGISGTFALYVGFGQLPHLANTTADLAVAMFIGWVGVGLAVLSAMVVLGSLTITRRSKYSLEVSPIGVRLQRSRKTIFFERHTIAGLVPTPRGMLLFTSREERWLLIPKTLDNYGDCVREIREMGVSTLPPLQPTRMQAVARWSGWLVPILAAAQLVLIFSGYRSPFLLDSDSCQVQAGIS